MPSFDVVSEIDLQEVRNVVDQAARELRGRFDFRGVDAGVSLEGEQVRLWAPEEFQVAQLLDILHDKMAKRRLDTSALAPGEVEGAGKVKRQMIGLKQGVDRDNARRIVKLVKDSKIKAQTQIQGDQVRVTGKKRDDLQNIIAAIKDADFDLPLQFSNFRD